MEADTRKKTIANNVVFFCTFSFLLSELSWGDGVPGLKRKTSAQSGFGFRLRAWEIIIYSQESDTKEDNKT